MTNKQFPLKTDPVNTEKSFIRERLSETIAGQSKLMDDLARQILIIELLLSGFYAITLKLLIGNDKLIVSDTIAFTFSCWIIAFICTIASLIPHSYKDIKRHDIASIEHFFDQMAYYKLTLLLPSLALLVIGIVSIVWGLLP